MESIWGADLHEPAGLGPGLIAQHVQHRLGLAQTHSDDGADDGAVQEDPLSHRRTRRTRRVPGPRRTRWRCR